MIPSLETELKPPKDDGGNRRKKHTAQNHYEVGFESLQLQSYLFAEFVMHAVENIFILFKKNIGFIFIL